MSLVLPLVLTLLYVSLISLFILGTTRIKYDPSKGYEPTVSIIVAARNEESNLHRCLESLSKLEYPTNKVEVIPVDDQSTDRTYEIMKSFATAHPHFTPVRVTTQIDHLRGKANAIAHGIDHSHGELIFLTDADCIVPPSWVKATVQQYGEDVGLVAGYTLLESKNWFGGMQSLDWAFLHTLAAGGVGLRKPLSCFGNNLTFRRKAYEEVGGLRKIPFSVTEDFALFAAITRRTKWDYRYLVTPSTLVMSLPCGTIRELFAQKQRWAVGGLDMKLKGYLMMGLGFTLNLLLLSSPLLGYAPIATLFLWIPKVAVDAGLITVALKRLRCLSLMKYFPFFEVYYVFYLLLLPFIILFGGKVVWKGRQY